MNATLSFIVLGLAAGALSGVVGVGGGVFVVPALVFFCGFSQLTAQGTSTALLLPPIGIFAAYRYWKGGYVDVRAAILICAGFLIGGWFGAKYATSIPQESLRRVFGLFMFVVSIKMLLGR